MTVSVGGNGDQHAIVNSDEPGVDIGLAVTDVDLIIGVATMGPGGATGPTGPTGPTGTTTATTNASLLTSGILPDARTPVMVLPTSIRGNLGSPSVAEMALIDSEANNKLWFYPPDNIVFETSPDDVTYTPMVVSDTNKRKFVSGNMGPTINWPKGQYLRITISNSGPYVYLNWLYAYSSSNGGTTQYRIEKRAVVTDVWSTVVAFGASVGSWPGHIFIPHATIPFSSSTTAGHNNTVRVTIYALPDPTYGVTYPNSTLYNFEWWGGYPAGKRTIYSWDELQNVQFPAGVSAGGLPLMTVQHGLTAARPALATIGAGGMFFDRTLQKPIWAATDAGGSPNRWVDAAGNTV